ncbi:TetR/AcrR family transcriptional regulator [Corynebacterium comes]|uniref:Transcriptional regulator, TetR family n=1 Tax=Corynebacterium comes TaxID=2675218 RepID=A0A6B8W312_9CORY|nr:TetR/AcrR family transcriptional regulator [Corynebacterium comes]QGU04140.1 Transcriptional regulator, TetR family [Corynebacterium comes]
MIDDTPLRERKRRATRRRIEEAATALVEKHGFENVTVEDICRGADISRRTFFNYMESKDEAVLGLPPMSIAEDRRRLLVDTPSDNLVRSALEQIVATMDDAESEVIEAGADQEFLNVLRERRHRIVAAEPSVAMMSVNRFREQAKLIHQLIVDHLEAHPADRRLAEQPPEIEASIIAALIRESVWLHMSRMTHHSESPADSATRARMLPETGRIISDFSKELSW